MNKQQAAGLRRGVLVKVHVPISGDVSMANDRDEEVSYPAGVIATVEDVRTSSGPQGLMVTLAYGGVVNVFDEADTPDETHGQFPITRLTDEESIAVAWSIAHAPFMRDTLASVSTDIESMVGAFNVYGCEITDEAHPWSGIWARLQRALWLTTPD